MFYTVCGIAAPPTVQWPQVEEGLSMEITVSTSPALSRREIIRRALRTSAYTAPVILAATTPSLVAAQVSPTPTPIPTLCTQPVAFQQDAILVNVAPGASFDVYFQPSTAPTPTRVGSITADAL